MLFGDRVTLRAATPDDFARLLAYKNVVEFELAGGGRPPRPMDADRFKDFYDTVLNVGDSTFFVIEADGHVIGDCGLHHRDIYAGTMELGIGIGEPDYWGKGFGRETIKLLLDFGFRMQNLRRVWLEVLGSNERGIRCYRACGFVEEGRLREHVWSDGEYRDLIHMGILRDEWLATHR